MEAAAKRYRIQLIPENQAVLLAVQIVMVLVQVWLEYTTEELMPRQVTVRPVTPILGLLFGQALQLVNLHVVSVM